MNELSEYRITDEDIEKKGVRALPDRLTGTAAQNKAAFDRLIDDVVQERFNNLIGVFEAQLVCEPYDAGKDYVPGNKVVYNGSAYVCIKACKDELPTDREYFQMYAAGGKNGDGAGDMCEETYDPQGRKADLFAYVDKRTDTYNRAEALSDKTAQSFVTRRISETAPTTPDEAFKMLIGGDGPIRYGFRIAKNNSDPFSRVEYLFDAVNMTPAHMNFKTGTFSYGSWKDVWFVVDNKPLMLNSDGTVAYYLDPNNYDFREDGETPSDIASTNHSMNGMAQIPLCWVNRYEDDFYEYTIISNVPYDEHYKAYAHTRMDGTIADYFYWSLFAGSLEEETLRSLRDRTPIANKTAQDEVNAAKLNGNLWWTHYWSGYQLINDLMILIGKSTDTQAVFGNGFASEGNPPVNQTGTLYNKGQFWGSNDDTHTLKVFHVERDWGQMDRIAGLMNNYGTYYVKMYRGADGYPVSDTTGMIDTGISPPDTRIGYIDMMSNTGYGLLPTSNSGSESTYYCDRIIVQNDKIYYAVVGEAANSPTKTGGAFSFGLDDTWSRTHQYYSAGLTCEMPH